MHTFKRHWGLSVFLTLGLIFLYLPLVVLIFYSFNASPLVTVWDGFSLKWYISVFYNHELHDAVITSLFVATCAASIALVLGVMAATSLKRYRFFWGRHFFLGMTITPLVMPDVITGLSLLLMFVGFESLIGWPSGRGLTTIIIAHATFCMAYITIMIQARLSQMDTSLEEAAMDLGARPLKTFFMVTLPQLTPSLIASWLLAFTLSIDDLVITTFVSGPNTTTLPMYIYSEAKLNPSPEINALASMMIFLVGIGVLVGFKIMMKYQKRK